MKETECIFSHNSMEILYHPLGLKTRLCRNKKNCHADYCAYAHNLQEDFRFLYGKENFLYKKLIFLFKKFDLFPDMTTVYKTKSNPISLKEKLPSEFHPDTYKTIECVMGNHCKLDQKLCLNYHNLFEKRRDLRLHFYSSRYCEDVVNEGKWKNPLNCKKVT
jgi:hypothetical protein